jgi:hypothetical protein
VRVKKDDRIYLRCSSNLKDELEKMAKEENRTLTNFIETVLMEKVEEYKVKKKKK